MNRETTGWVFVTIQVALLLLIIAVPGGDDWNTPGWLVAIGWAISILGVAVGLAAALKLGAALTPTPVPSGRGELTTHGLYRFVRHPIYTGVLALVLGMVVRSGSIATAAIGVVLLAFFTVKARWEEGQLREAYVGYDAYAAKTPRFVPRPGVSPKERPGRS